MNDRMSDEQTWIMATTRTPGGDCTVEYRQGLGWENWQVMELCECIGLYGIDGWCGTCAQYGKRSPVSNRGPNQGAAYRLFPSRVCEDR